jgi:hypothetical protein
MRALSLPLSLYPSPAPSPPPSPTPSLPSFGWLSDCFVRHVKINSQETFNNFVHCASILMPGAGLKLQYRYRKQCIRTAIHKAPRLEEKTPALRV